MTTNAVEDILGQIPADQLAEQLGVDPNTAMQAARAVIPSLIGGLQHNAQDLDGEQSLAGALLQHSGSQLFDSGQVDLAAVDVSDGEKIVDHVFGNQSSQLAQAIGQRTQGGPSLIDKLLPILAPIVLAYIAKQITGGSQAQGGGGGNILTDILGSVLGGGQPQQQGYPQQQAPQQQGSGGGILGDILGGILGGGLGGALGGGQAAPQQQSYPQQRSYPQQQSYPSNVPSGPDDPGHLQIDDSAPTTVDGRPLPGGQQSQQADGGVLGDILGGIFGRRG